MKIIHVPFGYFPDAVGGTEVYVAALAGHLAALGFENLVCAPGRVREAYIHGVIPVHRFPVASGKVDLRTLYGEGDELVAKEFGNIVERERPDIAHLHAFTSGVSLKLMREAKRRGCGVVFTFHTPSVTCIKGNLLREKSTCDGQLETTRCANCLAKHWGLDEFSAALLARFPVWFGNLLGSFKLQGGLFTAFRCRELIQVRHGAVQALFREVDHIVAVCEWVRRLLLRNGVPPDKITLSRQGVPFGGANPIDRERVDSPSRARGGLKLVCLGRFHSSKGFHVVIEAFRQAPDLHATLDIFGVKQDASATKYERQLRSSAANDNRIAFREAVPASEVTSLLGTYDLVVVPSEGLETGPLIALESLAAGTPVIGWNLGGLAETIRNGVDGILIEPPSIQGWVEALRRCAVRKELLQRLREGIRPPRTMQHVGEEMASLYATLK